MHNYIITHDTPKTTYKSTNKTPWQNRNHPPPTGNIPPYHTMAGYPSPCGMGFTTSYKPKANPPNWHQQAILQSWKGPSGVYFVENGNGAEAVVRQQPKAVLAVPAVGGWGAHRPRNPPSPPAPPRPPPPRRPSSPGPRFTLHSSPAYSSSSSDFRPSCRDRWPWPMPETPPRTPSPHRRSPIRRGRHSPWQPDVGDRIRRGVRHVPAQSATPPRGRRVRRQGGRAGDKGGDGRGRVRFADHDEVFSDRGNGGNGDEGGYYMSGARGVR